MTTNEEEKKEISEIMEKEKLNVRVVNGKSVVKCDCGTDVILEDFGVAVKCECGRYISFRMRKKDGTGRAVIIKPPEYIDHTATNEIVCPECGQSISGAHEMDDEGEEKCSFCGTVFEYYREVEVTYSTTKKEGSKNENE